MVISSSFFYDGSLLPHVEQELCSLPDQLSSPPFFLTCLSEVRVVRVVKLHVFTLLCCAGCPLRFPRVHVLFMLFVFIYVNWCPTRFPQGLAVIFSHRQVYVKREGRTLFLLPKVKVEFRHLFSHQKRLSLCSYHNINANIVVFC